MTLASDELASALATKLHLGSHHHDQQSEAIQARSSPKFVTLPIEILLRILLFADPQDVIRLRAVCHQLHDIIDDPSVWKGKYANSHLPLPPGPFPWQSNRTLQRTLLESDRLRRTWISKPLTHISTFISNSVIKGPKTQDEDRFVWIRGRWLLLSKQMKQLVCRDVDTNEQQVLWEGDVMSQWAACSVIGARGHLIYVAIRLGLRCRLDDPVKFLEFEVDDDTGRLTGPVTYIAPTATLRSEGFEPRLRLITSHSPLVEILVNPTQEPNQMLVFDTRTRRFYKYPKFRSKLADIVNYKGAWLPYLVETYPSNTHILVLSRACLIRENPGLVEVIQTFTLPPDADAPPDEFGVRTLRLTHEYLSRDRSQMSRAMTLIRNAVIDPVTKTTTLRYLHTFAPFEEPAARFVCTDYILPESGSKDVQPMFLESHDVFDIPGVWRGDYVEASDDGHVRGVTPMGYRYIGENTPPDVAYKWEVDATGERCTAVIGDASPQLPDVNISNTHEYSFDAFRGKFWFTRGDIRERNRAGEWVNDDVLAYVVDFK